MLKKILMVVACLLSVVQTSNADFGKSDGLLETEFLASSSVNEENTLVFLDSSETTARIVSYLSSLDRTPRSFTLNKNYHYTDIEAYFSNDGKPKTAVLAHLNSGNGSRVWVYNLTTGAPDQSFPLGTLFTPQDIEIFEDPAGNAKLAILGYFTASGRSQLRIHGLDGDTTHHRVDLGVNFIGEDLETVSDTENNDVVLATLGKIPSSGNMRIKGVSYSSLTTIVNISLGRYEPVDFIAAQQQDGKPFYAVLRKSSGLGGVLRTDVRSDTGSRLALSSIKTNDVPISLFNCDEHGQRGRAFCILHESPASGHATVSRVSPIDGALLSSLSFGSGAVSQSVTKGYHPTLGNFAVVSELRFEGEKLQTKIKTFSGKRVKTIPFGVEEDLNSWFSENRIHGHTRLSEYDPRLGLERSWHKTTESKNSARIFKSLGARVFTRHVKTGDEDPWWSSFSPEGAMMGESQFSSARENKGIQVSDGENLIQSYINEAWENNMPMMAYYWDVGEHHLADRNPGWVCKDHNNKVYTHKTKGIYLDITSDFGQIVENRLLEIADMGASGVYLDFRHGPPNGCWGTALADNFEQIFGMPAPNIGNTEAYREFSKYYANEVYRTLASWKDALHQEYPGFQLVVSVTSIPGLTRTDMSSKLATVASPKTEFEIAARRGQNNSVFYHNPEMYEPHKDIRMALGWTLLRDAAGSGRPHVWNAFMPNVDHVKSFISSVIGYGNIAALDVVEELLSAGGNVEGIASRQDLADGFSFGNHLSDHLGETDPMHWFGIHFSERVRDSYIRDSQAAWNNGLYSTVAAFEAGAALGVPTSVFTDEALVDYTLSNFRVIYIPRQDALDINEIQAIEDFTLNDGKVIYGNQSVNWSLSQSYQNKLAAIKNQITQLAPPVSAPNLPGGVHLVSHIGPKTSNSTRLVLAVINEFDFVQSTTIYSPIPAAQVNPKPEPIEQGQKVEITKDALVEIGVWPVHEIRELASGTSVPYTYTTVGIEITLPQIDTVSLIEIY